MSDPGQTRARGELLTLLTLRLGIVTSVGGVVLLLVWYLLIERPVVATVAADLEAHLEADSGDHSGKVGRIGFGAGLVIAVRQYFSVAVVVVSFLLTALGVAMAEGFKLRVRPERRERWLGWWAMLVLLVVAGGLAWRG